MQKKEINEGREINLSHLIKALLKKWWILSLSAVVCAIGVFVYISYFVTPKYSSSFMLYINNKRILDEDQISAADLSAAQSLVDSYNVILKSKTTMDKVAKASGIELTSSQLLSMTSTNSVEGTEILMVTITANDAQTAYDVATAISDHLPGILESVVEGSSMKVFDVATYNPNPISTNLMRNVIIGALIGLILSGAVLIFISIFDDTIKGEEDLQEYEQPILAQIPDIFVQKRRFYYYSSKKQYYKEYKEQYKELEDRK